MVLNALAAIFWAALFTAIGYQLGNGMKLFFRHVHAPAHVLVVLLAATLVALLVFRMLCRRLHHRTGSGSTDPQQAAT